MSKNYNGINPKTYARIKEVSSHQFAVFIAENRMADTTNSLVRKDLVKTHIKDLNKDDLRHFVRGWINYVNYRKKRYENRPEEASWLDELKYIKENYTSNQELFINQQAESLFNELVVKVDKTDYGLSLLYHVFYKNHKIIAKKEVYVEYCILNNIVSEIGSIRSEYESTQSEKNEALFQEFVKKLLDI